MLEVRNISFGYRGAGGNVLEDVSFMASPGEAVAVTGANGCGKTTLMRILSTAIEPDAGGMRLDGRDAFADPMRFRRSLGYMQEKPEPCGDMTVKAYLHYRARLKGEPERRIRRRVSEAAETCRIAALMPRAMRNLSFGQKKRVALAEAVLLRPRVVLLDDPLAGLDAAMRDAAGEAIAAVAAFSIVIATGHELAGMAKWATRFLVLSGGRIAAAVQTAGMDCAEAARQVGNALKGEG